MKYQVHPDAELFPMMPEDELATLAADIKENGQVQPIILGDLDGKEVIVDGRNRLKACEIAGVEPKFQKINGQDQKAYILSVNVNRRHMTAAQRAMATAMIYPTAERGGARKKGSSSATKLEGFSASRISYARAVLAHSPPIATAVLAGSKSLDEAYNEVQIATGKINNDSIRLRKLRDSRPDLAERVELNETKLDEAEAQAKADAEKLKQQRWAATKNLIEGVQMLDRDVENAKSVADAFDPSVAEQAGETISPARLRRVAAFANELAAIMEGVA